MKTLIITIFLCIGISANVFAVGADFKQFDSDSNYVYFDQHESAKYYAIKGTLKVDGVYRTIWTIQAWKPKGVREFAPNLRYRMSHSKSKYLFNCETGKMLNLALYLYDKHGSVIANYGEDEKATEVVPESPADTLFNLICSEPKEETGEKISW